MSSTVHCTHFLLFVIMLLDHVLLNVIGVFKRFVAIWTMMLIKQMSIKIFNMSVYFVTVHAMVVFYLVVLDPLVKVLHSHIFEMISAKWAFNSIHGRDSRFLISSPYCRVLASCMVICEFAEMSLERTQIFSSPSNLFEYQCIKIDAHACLSIFKYLETDVIKP